MTASTSQLTLNAAPPQNFVSLDIITERVKDTPLYSATVNAYKISKQTPQVDYSNITRQLFQGKNSRSIKNYVIDKSHPIDKATYKIIKVSRIKVSRREHLIKNTTILIAPWELGEKDLVLRKAKSLSEIEFEQQKLAILSVSDVHKRIKREVEIFKHTFIVPEAIASKIQYLLNGKSSSPKLMPSFSALPCSRALVAAV